MLVFWRQGYEATSLRDLTSALGVTPPSIYAAFGDKKQLFRDAVALYLGTPERSVEIIAEAVTARDAAEQLLEASAVGFTGTQTPPGCLLASATISCSPDAADVQNELGAIRRRIEVTLARKIRQDVRRGTLDADVDAGATAAHVLAVIQGMSTLARDGARRDKLRRVAAQAMQSWP